MGALVLQTRFKLGEPRQCFANAGRVIKRCGRRDKSLRYCEGYFECHGWRIHHAWIEDGDGNVHEVTLRPHMLPAREAYTAVVRLDWSEFLVWFALGDEQFGGPAMTMTDLHDFSIV